MPDIFTPEKVLDPDHIKCDGCGKQYPVMVMLKDQIWREACKGETKNYLCLYCIENNLGRQIQWEDIRECYWTNGFLLGALLEQRKHLPLKEDFVDRI